VGIEVTNEASQEQAVKLQVSGGGTAPVTRATAATTREIIGRMLPFAKPHYRGLAFAMVCLVIFGATDGAVPFLIKRVLDQVFTNQDRSLLVMLPAFIFVFAIVRGVADFGQQFLMARTGHFITRDIRNALNAKLLTQEPGYFIGQSGADLLARATSDVLMIRGLLTDSLSAIIRDSIRIVALLGACIYLDPVLALIAVVVFPLGVYPIIRFGKRLRKLARKGQDEIGMISSRLQESISGVRVVQLFSREEYERVRFERDNQALTNTVIKSERIRAFVGPINEVLAAAAVGAIIIYGGHSVLSGGRTQGDFIAFLVSVFLMYDPFKKLSRVHGVVQQGVAGAERILDVLDRKSFILEPETSAIAEAPQRFDLVLKNVSFKYPGKDIYALQDVSLTVPDGKTVALVGLSGSGKSTIVDIIPRFIDPSAGKVLIGGVAITDLSLKTLRSQIAVVGQHTFLFNDTVRANIVYGSAEKDLSEETLWRAIDGAGARDFIGRLPLGLETRVGEGGFALSGGERQRLSIARAIIKSAPILILDEATASLDNYSERVVQAALDNLAKSRTTLVVAHRLSTIQNADCIVVMAAGKVVEQGTHLELLAQAGEYARLHALQYRQNELVIQSGAH